jgi:pimeloyl-ACP methyl ester carboxylesterase
MPLAADLYYHAHEDGPNGAAPVVLLHGAGGSSLYWPAEVRRLTNHRIYALDLPGHGKSSGRGQQTISGYADSVIDWLTALSITRAYFIGHSLGGAISLMLALQYPEYVCGLGLIGAGARLPVDPEILAHTTNPTTHHKAVEALTASAFSARTDPHLKELAGKRMLENRLSVLRGDLLACDAFDVSEQLENIRQPALVLCGADDQLTPLRYSKLLAGTIPNARLEIIPDAGHMVMLEKPAEVAALLSDFLVLGGVNNTTV